MAHERYRRQTDRRQPTDGRAIAYSEREREFTFANQNSQGALFSGHAITYLFDDGCGHMRKWFQ